MKPSHATYVRKGLDFVYGRCKFPLHVYPKYIKGKEKDIKKLE